MASKMDSVTGQFVFVRKSILRPERDDAEKMVAALEKFVDGTMTDPSGFSSALIYRNLDNPKEFAIYETRTGRGDDVKAYRNSVEKIDESTTTVWYTPLARWQNRPGDPAVLAPNRVAFMRTFRVKPGWAEKEALLNKLSKLIEVVLEEVPDLRTAVIHENMDRPEELMLYEEWDRTKESFIKDEVPKTYRKVYREETDSFIEERKDLEWFKPIRNYKQK